MAQFEILGGVSLHGATYCSGAKNAALPIMAAAILASERVTLHNVPQLTDIATQVEVLRWLGMHVTQAGDRMEIETSDLRPVHAKEQWASQMRASFCVLGPLLARRGRAVVPLPGGCSIGNRPVDLHLKGLAALGANLRLEHGDVIAEARHLRGAEIDLHGPHGPTVTGTANVLSAAVLARGTTILHHAAAEPEIVDLGRFLTTLGSKIEGIGTSTLRIEGVEQLGGTEYRLIPDRIEAATLLLAAAITGGSVTISDVVPEHLHAVLSLLSDAGVGVHVAANSLAVHASRSLRPVDLVAQPYPGVPTDIQAQWTALMSTVQGTSCVRDRVFPSRFQHVAELNRLGARIDCHGDRVTINGVARLSGARVTACDLRASAALVLAGLAAEGRTTIDQIHHLDRGYERLDEKIRELGGHVVRMDLSPPHSVQRPHAAGFPRAIAQP
jgi:UDP-N-acetylglucosamine 1-carboxyvinyltransferase